MNRYICALLLSIAVTSVQADTKRGIALFNSKDYGAAQREFLKPASVSDPVAIRYHAYMLYTGTGVGMDRPRAKTILRKAYQNGNTASGRYLAELLFRNMRLQFLGPEYNKAELADLAEAMTLYEATYRGPSKEKPASAIADIFIRTEGRITPGGDVIRWFKLAAHEGDGYTAWKLAGAYAAGNGVSQSDSEAFYWAEFAAFLEQPEALATVGSMYVAGHNGPKRPKQGVALIARGAENRDNNAMLLLAEYLASTDEYENYPMAWRVLEIAQARGLEDSQRSANLAADLRTKTDWQAAKAISDSQYNYRFERILDATESDFIAAVENFKSRYKSID